MNNIFNLHRMGLYIRKHYIENAKHYRWYLPVLFAGMFILNYLSMSDSSPQDGPKFPFFYYILLLLATIPTILKSFYSKGSKIQALTLPVSRFEQYLLTLLSAVSLWIILITAYLCSAYILNLYYKLDYNFIQQLYISWTSPITLNTSLIFTAVVIWTMAGTKKNPLEAYLYTLLKYICFLFIIFLPWITKNINLYYKSIAEFPPYLYFYASKFSAQLTMNYRLSWLSEQQITTITIIFTFIAFTVFLVSGYYRHRERQVK